MKVNFGITLGDEELKNVSGGAGAAPEIKVTGVKNYSSMQNKCPDCGSQNIVYHTFTADDNIHTIIGQLCQNCNSSWSVGSNYGLKNPS